MAEQSRAAWFLACKGCDEKLFFAHWDASRRTWHVQTDGECAHRVTEWTKKHTALHATHHAYPCLFYQYYDASGKGAEEWPSNE
jgi:hypothetical protein